MADEIKTEGTSNKELIAQLVHRRSDIADALKEAEVIDDVLCNEVLKRKKGAAAAGRITFNANRASATYGMDVAGELNGTVTPNYPSQASGGELKYLPKGAMEPEDEYTKRIALTPFLPETPQIQRDRLSALFAEAPEIDGDEKDLYKDFVACATSNKQPFAQVALSVADAIGRYPVSAVFVNRAPLPDDVAARDGIVSVQEKETRKLGAAQLVVYTGEQILDFKEDQTGLVWIRILETSFEQAEWNSPVVHVTTVRIFDRQKIESYEIRHVKGEEPTVLKMPDTVHGFSVVPIVICLPPDLGKSGLGMPGLIGPATADIHATQVLSDLRWNAFVVGNPILTLTSNRSKEQLDDVNTNPGRYFVLRNRKGTEMEELLQFVTLDGTGIDILNALHEKFKDTAKSQAGKDAPGAINQSLGTKEQSGISKAWQFKTGQERILLKMADSLSQIFDKVFDLVAEVMGHDPEKVSVRFNTDFDIQDPTAVITEAGQLLPMFEGSPKATKIIKMRALTSAVQDIHEKDLQEIEDDLDKSYTKDVQQADEMHQATVAKIATPPVPVDAGAK